MTDIEAEEDSYLGAIGILRKRIKRGIAEPETKPKSLAIEEIHTDERVFQHRTGNLTASDAHVTTLQKALERDAKTVFPPITIYWIGNAWCCIDGHHRLKAYKSVRQSCVVPVQVFNGTLDAAIGQALAGNSRDKLPMQRREKSEAAWRLVTGTSLTKAAQARASGVSESQVALMRRTKADLIKTGLTDEELGEMPWYDAMLRAQGKSRAQEDSSFEDYLEEQGQLLANRLTKTFGMRLSEEPAILARALTICNSSLPKRLSEEWAYRGFLELDELMEDSDEEDLNPEF